MSKTQYFQQDYNSPRRWMSYWYQIDEIIQKKPKRILEIGKGSGVVSEYLKKCGFKITTCDFDKSVEPDVITDVRKLPFSRNEFDFILCAQVLEHLPFTDFPLALQYIYRSAKKWVLITLPDYSVFDFFLGIKIIPFIPKIVKTMKIRLPLKHNFDSNHYWEIGKRGYSLAKIRDIFIGSGFKIIKDYNPEENLFHHFFLLKKKLK